MHMPWARQRKVIDNNWFVCVDESNRLQISKKQMNEFHYRWHTTRKSLCIQTGALNTCRQIRSRFISFLCSSSCREISQVCLLWLFTWRESLWLFRSDSLRVFEIFSSIMIASHKLRLVSSPIRKEWRDTALPTSDSSASNTEISHKMILIRALRIFLALFIFLIRT